MPDLFPRLCLGMILSAGIAFGALRLRALSPSGGAAAWVVGTAIFTCGGLAWAAALLTFFITSSLLGRWSRYVLENRKKRRGETLVRPEKGGRRDAGQVLANGGIPALCALFGCLHLGEPLAGGELSREHGWATIFYVVFLTALSAANGDTWATELGTAYGRRQRLITTGRRVWRGTSGAVTVAGTLSALAGTLAIALFSCPLGRSYFAIVWASGLFGVFVDSVLGATLQGQGLDPATGRLTERWPAATRPVRGVAWIRNDQVNALSILSASVMAAWLALQI